MKPVEIAYWFFRLNGCFTITNFIVHPDTNKGKAQRTEADILAVRFPYRKELPFSEAPLVDHMTFKDSPFIEVIVSEVTQGKCKLNGPWTRQDTRNVDRVLSAIGIFPEKKIKKVASALYSVYAFQCDSYRFRFFSIGKEKSGEINSNVIQLTWTEILHFTYDRFRNHSGYKRDHEQWDETGKKLYEMAVKSRKFEEYQNRILGSSGIKQ